jgi:hypothetical protein
LSRENAEKYSTSFWAVFLVDFPGAGQGTNGAWRLSQAVRPEKTNAACLKQAMFSKAQRLFGGGNRSEQAL